MSLRSLAFAAAAALALTTAFVPAVEARPPGPPHGGGPGWHRRPRLASSSASAASRPSPSPSSLRLAVGSGHRGRNDLGAEFALRRSVRRLLQLPLPLSVHALCRTFLRDGLLGGIERRTQRSSRRGGRQRRTGGGSAQDPLLVRSRKRILSADPRLPDRLDAGRLALI